MTKRLSKSEVINERTKNTLYKSKVTNNDQNDYSKIWYSQKRCYKLVVKKRTQIKGRDDISFD